MIDYDRLVELGDKIAEETATKAEHQEYADIVEQLENEEPTQEQPLTGEIPGFIDAYKKVVQHQCYYCNTTRNIRVSRKQKYLKFTCDCGVRQKEEIRKLKEFSIEEMLKLQNTIISKHEELE
jgi:hypothetical protein